MNRYYTYMKWKKDGLGLPGPLMGFQKVKKAPKLEKSVSKWVMSGYILF
jgi:hypothetical protein